MVFNFFRKKPVVRSILPQQVAEKMAENATTKFFDVREPSELPSGAAQGSVNLPISSFSVSQLPGDKATPLIFICERGGRSSKAAEMAAQAGYSNVYNVIGGTSAWLASNLPRK